MIKYYASGEYSCTKYPNKISYITAPKIKTPAIKKINLNAVAILEDKTSSKFVMSTRLNNTGPGLEDICQRDTTKPTMLVTV